jgi:hypothetical protein
MRRRQFHLLHTACVFEKNYRLQDIQLSKSLKGSRPLPQPFSLTRLRRAEQRLEARRSTVARCASMDNLLQTCQPQLARTRQRRLVENTGLEPVTSWLQTRRSPS